MNTLRVETVKTETTPGEFVTDGFRVTPVLEDGTVGEPLYGSRFANKAMAKAFVLLGSEQHAGWAVTVESSEVTDVAGRLNLEQRIDADRFRAIRGLATADIDVSGAIEAMKANDAAGPAAE